MGGGNSSKVWVKTASSETIIVFLVCWTSIYCDGSVKYLFFCLSGYLSAWLSIASSEIYILHFFGILQLLEIYKNQGP